MLISAYDLRHPTRTSVCDPSIALDLGRRWWLAQALADRARCRRAGERLWGFSQADLDRGFSEAARRAGMEGLHPCLYTACAMEAHSTTAPRRKGRF